MSDYVVSEEVRELARKLPHTRFCNHDGHHWSAPDGCTCGRERLLVLLDTATPVERRYMSADVPHDARWAWVHTRDEEAP